MRDVAVDAMRIRGIAGVHDLASTAVGGEPKLLRGATAARAVHAAGSRSFAQEQAWLAMPRAARDAQLGAASIVPPAGQRGGPQNYAVGTRFEHAVAKHLIAGGRDIGRNTDLDLVLHDGTQIRPDLLRWGDDGKLFIGEVKRRMHMPYTQQLHDYVDLARANHTQLQLFMPTGSTVTRDLQAAIDGGDVVRTTLRG